MPAFNSNIDLIHLNHYEKDERSFLYSPVVRIVPLRDPILDDQPICVLCDTPFSEESKLCGGPRILPCGHIFGRFCMGDMFLETRECPFCGTKYPIVFRGESVYDWHYQHAYKCVRESRRHGSLLSRIGHTHIICVLILLKPTFDLVEATMDVSRRPVPRRTVWELVILVTWAIIRQCATQILLGVSYIPLLWMVFVVGVVRRAIGHRHRGFGMQRGRAD